MYSRAVQYARALMPSPTPCGPISVYYHETVVECKLIFAPKKWYASMKLSRSFLITLLKKVTTQTL